MGCSWPIKQGRVNMISYEERARRSPPQKRWEPTASLMGRPSAPPRLVFVAGFYHVFRVVFDLFSGVGVGFNNPCYATFYYTLSVACKADLA